MDILYTVSYKATQLGVNNIIMYIFSEEKKKISHTSTQQFQTFFL